MNISLFENMTSKEPSTGSLESVAELIRHDEKLKAFTLSYRQTGSKAFKNEAPLFAVACRFNGGKGKENATALTGLSLVDFDHILNEERRVKNEEFNCYSDDLESLKAKIIADPHTVMCYTTISGNGLRVIFRYENRPHGESVKSVKSVGENRDCVAYYQQAFYAGNAYYEKLLGLKADMQCKNMTRLSGLAHDPGVFLRPESEAVAFTAEDISVATVAHTIQTKEGRQMARIQNYFDTFIAPQLAKAGIAFRSGSHNDYVMRVGYRLAERRFAKAVAVKWAVGRFGGDYPDTAQVVGSCFANAKPRGDDGRGSGGGGGGRGENLFASVDEIKAFLDGHVSLRFNEITSRVEFLQDTDDGDSPSGGSLSNTELTEHTDFSLSNTNFTNYTNEGDSTSGSSVLNTNYTKQRSAAEGKANKGDNTSAGSVLNTNCTNYTNKGDTKDTGEDKFVKFEKFVFNDIPCNWQPINDRKVNSLWAEMSQVTRVNKQDLFSIIESDYVPVFNPFKDYLSALERSVFKKDHDYIRELADTVSVKGTEQDQDLWYRYLKKWLVGMVASWISDDVVNNVILVLIGEQGSFKTTWFNYLLPPELKQYFYTKTNANRMSKDDLLTLAQYALVCCEELDSMRPAELNQLKAAVTMPSIDERAAYAHFHEHRKHIASFCGTGNNPQFLSDPTGNRRWLPFEVESIVSPRDHPFNYLGIYSQALALYQSGFRFWFSKEEILELNKHNRQFETPRLEWELVALYFRVPTGAECGMFMTSARAMQIVGAGISQKLNATRLGLAFHELGFKRVRYNGIRGYYVVMRTVDEMQAYQRGIAPNDVNDEEDDDDANDLPF